MIGGESRIEEEVGKYHSHSICCWSGWHGVWLICNALVVRFSHVISAPPNSVNVGPAEKTDQIAPNKFLHLFQNGFLHTTLVRLD